MIRTANYRNFIRMTFSLITALKEADINSRILCIKLMFKKKFTGPNKFAIICSSSYFGVLGLRKFGIDSSTICAKYRPLIYLISN